MYIDYSGAELFLKYIGDQADLDDVWNHPAYRVIREHAELLRGGLSKEQIKTALEGERSGYYGLKDVKENVEKIEDLIDVIKDNENEWLETLEHELNRVVPDVEKEDIPIYPVFGYDIGIGLENGVCINLNEGLFFQNPRQFLYMAIHESSHSLYDRVHDLHSMNSIREETSSEGRTSMFNTFLHTEGYAVYTPLNIRKEEGQMGKGDHFILDDYTVIADEDEIKKHVRKYDQLQEELKSSGDWSLQEYVKKAFGKDRLAYRVGCVMISELEREKGMDGVKRAFHMDADRFVKEYDHLLDVFR